MNISKIQKQCGRAELLQKLIKAIELYEQGHTEADSIAFSSFEWASNVERRAVQRILEPFARKAVECA